MATELSNYDNDYRLRYRTSPTTAGDLTTGTVSQVGIGVQAADYNVMPLPVEADYGMYADGTGTAADPYNAFADQPPALTAASFAGMVDFPRNDGLGALDGRYSIDFVADAEGQAGFSIPQGTVAPASPSVGSLWYDTANLALMVYINDGNSLQWVQAN
jgi:hypothetical protein